MEVVDDLRDVIDDVSGLLPGKDELEIESRLIAFS